MASIVRQFGGRDIVLGGREFWQQMDALIETLDAAVPGHDRVPELDQQMAQLLAHDSKFEGNMRRGPFKELRHGA